MRVLKLLAPALAAAVLCVGSAAQAGTADFTYYSTVNGQDGTGTTAINPNMSTPVQGSVVNASGQFSAGSQSSTLAGSGVGSDIVVGNYSIKDLNVGAYTDTYGAPTSASDVTVFITHNGSTVAFVFNGGMITGTVASDGITDQSDLTKSYAGVTSPVSHNVGGVIFTVAIKNFASPGAPPVGGTGQTGAETFHVTGTSGPRVPEPGALALAFTALPALGLYLRRRRTRA